MNKESTIVDAEIVEETVANDQTTTQQNTDKKDDDLGARLLSSTHWIRCVFMVLFAVIAGVASYVIAILIIIQFLFALVTGSSEARLQAFGNSLSQYIYQILRFLTYNSEDKPFPFSDWSNVDEQESDSENN